MALPASASLSPQRLTVAYHTALKYGTFWACGYEWLAGHSGGRLPTLSHICGRHPWVIPVLVVGLLIHLLKGWLKVRAILDADVLP